VQNPCGGYAQAGSISGVEMFTECQFRDDNDDPPRFHARRESVFGRTPWETAHMNQTSAYVPAQHPRNTSRIRIQLA
jgi:hypothetical protein